MMDMIINLISTCTGIVCVASIICSLTPTPKDDAFYKIIEVLALNIGKAKD